MKLILIRSPQLLFYKMKSKQKIRTWRRIQLQFQDCLNYVHNLSCVIFLAKNNLKWGKSSKSVKTSISMMPHITNLTPFQNGTSQRQVRLFCQVCPQQNTGLEKKLFRKAVLCMYFIPNLSKTMVEGPYASSATVINSFRITTWQWSAQN